MQNHSRHRRYSFDGARAEQAARSAETLAGVLHEVGLTHRDVSRLLGVSLYTVDSWTRAVDPKIPGAANLERLCSLLESRTAGLGRKIASAAVVKWAGPPVPTEQNVTQRTSAPQPQATNLRLPATSFV